MKTLTVLKAACLAFAMFLPATLAIADISYKDLPKEVTPENYKQVGQALDQWIILEDNRLGKVSMLPSSIAEDELSNPTIWMKMEFIKPEKGVKVQKIMYVFNCSIHKYGISNLIAYDRKGNVVKNISRPTVLSVDTVAIPQTFQYGLMQALCD